MTAVWAELKRRNVVRVAIAYAIVSWLILQLADVLMPLLSLPEWVGGFVLLLLLIGFPVALIFAWAFELTPEGLKKEKEIDHSASITQQTGRKLDFIIIALLVVGLGYLAYDKFVLGLDRDADLVQTTTEAVTELAAESDDVETAGKSIAVLPFANMSADESTTYFSDGLADTVLHMLAQVPGLRVAARTSSFQFRDQPLDIAKIGDQLNVSTILEGGVQRSGDTIRVTAQLIDVSNGYHLWSGNFDRDLDDIFAIQDEIANEVVSALKVSLLGESNEHLRSDQTDNIDAYTQYLLAVNDLNDPTYESLESAANHLQEAIRLDPDYAKAHSTLGRTYFSMEDYGAMSRTEATAAARTSASRALDIAPDSSEALAVLGQAERRGGNMEMAGRLLNKAIESGPNDTVALGYYADYLRADARPVESMAIYQKILQLDPLSERAHFWLAMILMSQHQYAEASETVSRLKDINPKSSNAVTAEYWIENRQGHYAAAIALMRYALTFDSVDPEGPGLLGHSYLALDMPAEASQSFDRAVELDAQHPMSRSAPLFLNYYLQQNEDENFQLARELLEDRIDDRFSSRTIALIVLIEYAAKTGRNDVAVEVLDNLYPHLFDDPPYDLDRDLRGTFYAGLALIQSGDTDRGSHLMQAFLDLQEPRDEVYDAYRLSIAGRLILGDRSGALDKLTRFAQNIESRMSYGGVNYWALNRMILERSPVFDPLRNEPAFIALLNEYRENAEEQRQILQAMNEDASGQ